MRIYVASSWRNDRQQGVVAALRAAHHSVYDFRNPEEGDTGFSWRQCTESEADLVNPQWFRDKVLAHPRAQEGFRKDMKALREAEVTVLTGRCSIRRFFRVRAPQRRRAPGR